MPFTNFFKKKRKRYDKNILDEDTILFEDSQFNTILGETGVCMISLKPEFLLYSNSGLS